MRLIDPLSWIDKETKLTHTVRRIRDIWEERQSTSSTQLVFCDLSTPDANRFTSMTSCARSSRSTASLQTRSLLFMTLTQTPRKNSVKAGKISILVGLTAKTGADTNVQRRLAAMHHLDAPWPPRH